MLGAVMITTPISLTACDNAYKLHRYNSYESLTDLKIVEIETVNGNSVWLINKSELNGEIRYFDVFSGERVFSTENDEVITSGVTLISEEDFIQYLIGYERIQSDYKEEEVQEIFNQVKQDFYEEKENVKVKK